MNDEVHDRFKDHRIARRDDRSLLLQQPGEHRWNLWCTIVIDDGGQIVVFGDFGPVVFGHCSRRMALAHRIAWLGLHEQADGYVCEKACIGMSDYRDALTVTTWETFEADVREAFKERRRELQLDARCGDSSEPDEAAVKKQQALTWDAFREALDCNAAELLENGEPLLALQELHEYLSELGYEDNWEWIGGVGKRPIPQIAMAHAALRRAHLLLEEEREYVERCARDS